MHKQLTQIETGFPLPGNDHRSYDRYVESIQYLVDEIVEPFFKEENGEVDLENSLKYYERIKGEIPLVHHSPFSKDLPIISVTCVCSAKYTHGTGRFMCDLFSRWLIPGKQIPIINTRSLAFKFRNHPKTDFYLNELILNVMDLKDIPLVQNNLPIVIKELKLNILAVQHARHVVSIKPLTLDQKKILIQENITSLVDRKKKEIEPSMYEFMHQLIMKFLAEDKMTQIKDQITPFIEMKPTAFDRDIYSEMQQFMIQLNDSFIVRRDIKYLNRVISYHYIFRKIIGNSIKNKPSKRHLSLKILRTKLHTDDNEHPVLGLLMGVNFVDENEIFEERHFFKAVQSVLPTCTMVKNSHIIDRRGDKKIRTVYLEVEKPERASFKPDEIKMLRKNLPLEIKNRIASLIHPVFVQRNDEEIMRNILDLSKQLKYIHDLPQVIVNFHKQTNFEISFIIIILRLKKQGERCLKEVFQTTTTMLKFYEHDIRIVGILRKRYPKEAHVIEVRLDKKQFLRKDFSLDIHKARLCVISEITRIVGDVRDYNGGMISKQYEVLTALKGLLLKENIHNDFLLENFFYSLTPKYMQSLLSPVLLKNFFIMLLDVLEHEFNKDIYFMDTNVHEQYYMVLIGTVQESFMKLIQELINDLLTSSHEISYSCVNIYDISCVGLLLRFDEPKELAHFEKEMKRTLDAWEKQVKEEKEEISPVFLLDEITKSS
ncbi:hypothetical protein COB11_00505 [Candidatus Aerophobetes bacterium]|uniref:Uncharacterized protein n=1 Tax=Aerophobetes bacterium TaxID=2030807 RepID=A0A2A4YMD5_UNCAE|nr:MAG: hypothetical protein COB11_00505 [Candidatus Aerophobetes bacterium]